MINTQKLVKVAMVWTSVVYAVCFVLVAMVSPLRSGFMKYGMHMDVNGTFQYVMTFGTFVSGLVIWNVISVLAVWLFAALWNKVK